MKYYRFTAKIGDEMFYPKGFYYQKKHVILVGDTVKGHTIRRKELIEDVELTVEDYYGK